MLALAPPAVAQKFIDRIQRTTSVTLRAQAVSGADSAACGISGSLIQESFYYPVSASALNVLDKKTDPLAPELSIDVTTIHGNTGMCFSSVIMVLHSIDVYPNPAAKDEFFTVDDLMWRDAMIAVSMAQAHPQYLREIIENMTKRFLTYWNISRKHPGG